MKLRYQSVMISAIPIALFAIIMIVFSFTVLYDNMIQNAINELQAIGQLASHEMKNPMYRLDVDALNEIIDGLESHDNIMQVLVLYPDGRVLTDGSDEDYLYDTVIDDWFFNQIIELDNEFTVIEQGMIHYSIPIMLDEKIGILTIKYDLTNIYEDVKQTIVNIVIVSLVLISVFYVIGVYLSRSITKPLHRIIETVDNISKQNHTTSHQRFNIPEIQNLYDKIEEMYSKLQTYQNEMLKKKKLATIGETSARITHDLRNPLTIIKNSTELLKQKNPDFVRQNSKYFDFIDSAVENINSKINDVLNHARTPVPQKSLTKFSKLVETSLASIDIPKNITITTPTRDYEVWCDSKQIENVLSNLLQNAKEELGDRQGQITIEIEEENEFHKISIADSGSGIPEESLYTVFEPLYTTKSLGTGLGLVNCSNIIKAHNGKIYVENSKNGGAVFTILLPKIRKKDDTMK